ncbi:MAG: hypothetical protein JNL85_00065 [Rubrivivax sp.]|nr:hypothetical protein [Rubrivivax sp.]
MTSGTGPGAAVALALLLGALPAAPAAQPAPAANAEPSGVAEGAGAGAATHAAAADLAAARATTDRRDFAAALPLYERLVQRAPGNADLLIEAARVFGWADRNARSAALYRQALAAAPARRGDIVPSLAWQTLWSAGAGAAVPLFEEAVAHEPRNRELGWALANALNTAGRHREALAVFGRWLPAASERERMDLARALRWAGYEDRAWPLLREAREPEAAWLRDYRSARDVAPYGWAALELSEDRDTLRSRSVAAGVGSNVFAGTIVELGTRRATLDDAGGSAGVTTFEASARTRLGEPESPAGTWWPQLVLRTHRVGSAAGSWHPFTSTVRLKWVPADRWRVDAEHSRELIETPLALANRVHAEVTSLGADWRRDERLALAGSVARVRFDDGTARQRLAARGEWALLTGNPRWTAGVEASHLQRTSEGAPGSDARGYWNPRRYDEARAFTGAHWDWRPWELQARLGLGRSREVDGAGNASTGGPHLWELALAWDPSPAWRLRASAGGSGQALGLAAGGASGAKYWRRWANLGLSGWF